ncbi:MAG: hypothetical protein ABIP41_04665 [Croceibacterium sp.]
MQFRTGTVPDNVDGRPVAVGDQLLAGDAYLLRTTSGFGYFYRKGHGLIVEQPPGADPNEQALWLNAGVYSAVACINGLKPIHASAVAWDGRVYAFTGAPGAGKSTLVAALGDCGLPMFCDDTLVLDLSGGPVICLPGHKRLKLTPQALALTGAQPQEKVSSAVDKFFAVPASGEVGVPLPLAQLVFLERGEIPAVEPLSGGERLARLGESHYTEFLFEQANALDRAEVFQQRAQLARRVAMSRLVRPWTPDRVAQSADFVARWIRAAGKQRR